MPSHRIAVYEDLRFAYDVHGNITEPRIGWHTRRLPHKKTLGRRWLSVRQLRHLVVGPTLELLHRCCRKALDHPVGLRRSGFAQAMPDTQSRAQPVKFVIAATSSFSQLVNRQTADR